MKERQIGEWVGSGRGGKEVGVGHCMVHGQITLSTELCLPHEMLW